MLGIINLAVSFGIERSTSAFPYNHLECSESGVSNSRGSQLSLLPLSQGERMQNKLHTHPLSSSKFATKKGNEQEHFLQSSVVVSGTKGQSTPV